MNQATILIPGSSASFCAGVDSCGHGRPGQRTNEKKLASNREMFTSRLRALSREQWRSALKRGGLIALYVLMTVQFVGCYLFHTFPYIDVPRFTHGYERLPFQTRLLLAPVFHWAAQSLFMVRYASHLARNGYFFPTGVGPTEVLEFWLDIPCVLIAGWVTVRLYQAASRRQLLTGLVYPLFLLLCVVSYILHTVQNFRFVYDMPSLAFFAVGLYLIYFRKPTVLLMALFAFATLNRETTLFLIPFYLLSELARADNPTRPNVLSPGVLSHRLVSHEGIALAQNPPEGRGTLAGRVGFFRVWFSAMHGVAWKRLLRPQVVATAALMLMYWAAWHVFIFHFFRNNASEYYSRIPFNLYCFRRLRYYPQLFSACGYLLPFLILFRRHLHDAQLRLWMWAIPGWFGVMFFWGILVETRVFGELLPVVACITALVAEEVFVAAVRQRDRSEEEEERVHLVRAA